ncbi:Mitochondrial carrier protein LEU5 [Penicillium atrosanguineum]|uniref:Mitochondrial thiamine pyrophosphate carrier 1 n=1 Tax=Penicillium atrosanguineum TaxID=1132637 RepID=A0A9W9PVZ6_9EURO|nr:ATPase synthesis protein 25 [Penicillium atrosanguineum]KAJ5140058.1 Mitochondrial carrier protein LEU5 [Penicillium atrosanguineum]KAJ5309972.1 ATPase synthesis protein 25 [Penicillium atrosanguineum]KAJ5315491.1 Mitochondrial carrier protein LEU5 [Penicillium atrosanguineum]
MSDLAQSRSSGPIATGAGAQLATGSNSEKQKDSGTNTVVKTRSLDYVLRSGLAGGLAGCAAKTVVAPLDRVKILFQASNPQFAKYTGSLAGLVAAIRDIKRSEGSRGLFKGHSATLLRIFPYAAIKFLAYEQIRAVVISSPDQETSIRRLVSGSMAGITSVFFTYPLELVRVRLAFETKKSSRSSLKDICRQIYNERITSPSRGAASHASTTVAAAESVSSTVNKAVPRSGFANFYRGFGPTILGMVPYAGMSFLTHDTIGDWLRHPSVAQYTTIPDSESKPKKGSRHPQLTATAELSSGALAGLVSQTSSYPLEVVRRRMQVGGAVGDGRRLGLVETGKKIYLERGFRGFWVGLTIGYMKVVPMVATSFFVYERLKWSLGI